MNALGNPSAAPSVAGGLQPYALLGAGARSLLATLRLVTLSVRLVTAAVLAPPAARRRELVERSRPLRRRYDGESQHVTLGPLPPARSLRIDAIAIRYAAVGPSA